MRDDTRRRVLHLIRQAKYYRSLAASTEFNAVSRRLIFHAEKLERRALKEKRR